MDGSGTSTYSYDPFSELTSTTSGQGQTTSYTYDSSGNNTSISYGPAIAVNQATDSIYIINYRSSTVSVIDGHTNKVVRTIPVGSIPSTIP